jgi:hypothetical protein
MSTYQQDHKLAKLIVFALVILCMLLNQMFQSILLNILSVGIWFFGVNPVAYIIETIKGHPHKHDKV